MLMDKSASFYTFSACWTISYTRYRYCTADPRGLVLSLYTDLFTMGLIGAGIDENLLQQIHTKVSIDKSMAYALQQNQPQLAVENLFISDHQL